MTPVEQAADLADLLAGDEPDWADAPAPPAGLDQVNGMLRRKARLLAEVDAASELASAEHARIDLWLSLEADRVWRQVAYLDQCLALFHEARLAEDPKAKTIRLPAGELRAREATRWSFTDEFLSWALDQRPDLVRRKPAPAPEIDRVAAKKALVVADGAVVTRAGGELPPGVTFEVTIEFTSKPATEVGP